MLLMLNNMNSCVPLTSFSTSLWINNNITPLQNSISMNTISSLGLQRNVIDTNPYIFSNQIDYGLPITNQKSSGRCWLFAASNLVRTLGYDKLQNQYGKIEDFEISQNYLFFWDKLERYHRNLRYYIDIKSNPKNMDRYLYQLNQDPMGDGGQWDMAKDIISKYGVVPKQVFPDTHHSSSSREMNKILTLQLKSDFNTLDNVDKDVIESAIEIMMNKIFKMLVGFLGKPPTKFNWTFKNKDSKIFTLKDLTPKSYLKMLDFKPDDWVSVINDPRESNLYNKYYMAKYLGNVKDSHVGWINVEMDRMNELTKNSIDRKYPVWFGCDVGNEWDRSSGVQHPGIIDLKNIIGLDSTLDKGKRLQSYSSLPNHAMLITGYHQEDEVIKRWKVENSWGKNSGSDGFLLMTNEWMNQYVFQTLINKQLLNEQERQLLSTTPQVVEPWDPLGTLA